MAPSIPSETEVLGWLDSLSNWGRWGSEDELGTANLITPEKRLQAAGLVREGITVSCARGITFEHSQDNPVTPGRYMTSTGETPVDPEVGWSEASEVLHLG